MKTKVTFKNFPKETGLAAIGNPNQSIECKIKRKTFGHINAPNWASSEKVWTISIMVMKTELIIDNNPNCNWKWIYFKAKFVIPDQAKIWLQEKIEEIMKTYELRFEE